MKYISNSAADTQDIATEIARKCFGNEIIILNGDLGAGKTTFTKGFARALGIKSDITSPTFTLMKTYKGGRLTLYHFDLYRIENVDDIEELGFEEYFNQGGICVIEWNKFSDFQQKVITINFAYNGENSREIDVEGLDESIGC